MSVYMGACVLCKYADMRRCVCERACVIARVCMFWGPFQILVGALKAMALPVALWTRLSPSPSPGLRVQGWK